jgi:hypothetical protein
MTGLPRVHRIAFVIVACLAINHNGLSEENELIPLLMFGIESISLDYDLSRRADRYGNAFRYRARISTLRGRQVGPFAYDVFLAK